MSGGSLATHVLRLMATTGDSSDAQLIRAAVPETLGGGFVTVKTGKDANGGSILTSILTKVQKTRPGVTVSSETKYVLKQVSNKGLDSIPQAMTPFLHHNNQRAEVTVTVAGEDQRLMMETLSRWGSGCSDFSKRCLICHESKATHWSKAEGKDFVSRLRGLGWIVEFCNTRMDAEARLTTQGAAIIITSVALDDGPPENRYGCKLIKHMTKLTEFTSPAPTDKKKRRGSLPTALANMPTKPPKKCEEPDCNCDEFKAATFGRERCSSCGHFKTAHRRSRLSVNERHTNETPKLPAQRLNKLQTIEQLDSPRSVSEVHAHEPMAEHPLQTTIVFDPVVVKKEYLKNKAWKSGATVVLTQDFIALRHFLVRQSYFTEDAFLSFEVIDDPEGEWLDSLERNLVHHLGECNDILDRKDWKQWRHEPPECLIAAPDENKMRSRIKSVLTRVIMLQNQGIAAALIEIPAVIEVRQNNAAELSRVVSMSVKRREQVQSDESEDEHSDNEAPPFRRVSAPDIMRTSQIFDGEPRHQPASAYPRPSQEGEVPPPPPPTRAPSDAPPPPPPSRTDSDAPPPPPPPRGSLSRGGHLEPAPPPPPRLSMRRASVPTIAVAAPSPRSSEAPSPKASAIPKRRNSSFNAVALHPNHSKNTSPPQQRAASGSVPTNQPISNHSPVLSTNQPISNHSSVLSRSQVSVTNTASPGHTGLRVLGGSANSLNSDPSSNHNGPPNKPSPAQPNKRSSLDQDTRKKSAGKSMASSLFKKLGLSSKDTSRENTMSSRHKPSAEDGEGMRAVDEGETVGGSPGPLTTTEGEMALKAYRDMFGDEPGGLGFPMLREGLGMSDVEQESEPEESEEKESESDEETDSDMEEVLKEIAAAKAAKTGEQ